MAKTPAAKEQTYTRVAFMVRGRIEQYNVDSRVWDIFERKAGDKLKALEEAAGKLVAEGKTPERALADTLEAYRLV